MSQRKAFIDGKWQWVEEGPAYGGSIRWGGTTNFGGPGSYERGRVAKKAQKERDAALLRDALEAATKPRNHHRVELQAAVAAVREARG